MNVPRRAIGLLIISYLAMIGFMLVSAINQYALIKPFVVEISAQPSPFTVDAVSFNYDPALNRYVSCEVTVTNNAASELMATVYVQLNNATGVAVASGSKGVTLASGESATVTVELSWSSNASVEDIAGGWITVT